MSYYNPYYGYPNLPQTQQQPQQQQRQYAAPQPPLQVSVPPRQPQMPPQYSSPPTAPPPAQYPFQQQYPPLYQQFSPAHQFPAQGYSQDPYAYNQTQQAFAYQQSQQRYQPPPPPRVVVPSLPSQYQKQYRQYEQPSPKSQEVGPPPVQTLSDQPKPQVRVLQDIKQNRPVQQSHPQPKISPQTRPATTNTGISTSQYPSLLLTLADEYVEASKRMKARNKEYYRLITTALGCIDVSLRNFQLEPLREAQLSLKYAQLLYDETNNLDEAETVLTKSIDLCERMKFIDLKYAMQLLLAKVLYRSKPRAAIRDLQSMISDIETYRHVAWEYPFRFQAVFFAVITDSHPNLHECFHQLERIQHVAKLNHDHGVYAYAAVLESLLYLHSPGSESITNSQRAMAKARSLQLNPDVENHPQMPVLMEIIDLMWSLGTANEAEIAEKRKNLKDSIYTKSIDNPAWARDEFTLLRISTSSLKGIPTQEGGLIHALDGKHYMALNWIGKKELEAIGFLLMGVALVPQNRQQKGKAENFLNGGYPVVKDEMLDHDAMLSGKDQRLRQRCHILCIHFKAEAAFLCCSQGQWQKAHEITKLVAWHISQIKDSRREFEALLAYLRGCIAQGVGDLDAAVNFFQSKHLAIQAKQSSQSPAPKAQGQSPNHITQNLRLLAAMNTALIIRSPSHPRHQHLQSLIDTIGTHITPTSPPLITSTYSILLSTMPSATVLQMKQLLNESLNTARKTANNQIISLTLALMQDKFFRGGVQHAQAVKCAKAAAHQVKTKWGSPLWTPVAEMMELESLMLQPDPVAPEELETKRKEIAQKQRELQQAWTNVPETVKVAMKGD